MLVLVVEDHALVREGLCIMLDSNAAFERSIECPSLAVALSEARKAGESLGLVLMDLSLPDADGLESVERFHTEFPEVPVLVVSGHVSGSVIDDAFAKGARGYLPKNSGRATLELAVQAVLSGEYYVPPHLLQSRPGFGASSSDEKTSSTQLTRRQSDVLVLLARGLANKEIAQELDLSLSTVRGHISAILRLLDVENRTQAAMSPEAKRLVGAA